MDVVRRNTDYALRAMVNLVGHYGNEPVPSREMAQQGQIPYQLTCKLMQKLRNAGLVESCMGPKGGFRLGREPSRISLLEVIEAIQGKILLNRCLLGENICPWQKKCTVRMKLAELAKSINSYLGSVTLDELARTKGQRRRRQRDKERKSEKRVQQRFACKKDKV